MAEMASARICACVQSLAAVGDGVPDLLEQRLCQSKMQAFLDDHPELLPAGLNADSKYTITVYKARAK